MSDRRARSTAEWVTLVGSCAVLAAVAALLAIQITRTRTPAAPEAVVTATRTTGAHHAVTVEVTNHGDTTAANVQVRAELDLDGDVHEGDQTIDFLAGHEVTTLVFVFDDDPSRGELTVTVSSFAVP